MFERKAILISENKITNLDDNDNTRLVIFDLQDNRVVGVETIEMNKDLYCKDDLHIYLSRKYIKVIYLSTIDGITNSKCIKLGIEVKKVTSIEEDKLLSSLYLIPPFF
ncbi:MAG: hypothetical protein M0Q52_05810 [Lascolabacillus sp.]|jgi:hypothetical protein|nr:hypothetical protein [Lascolabacillus sp.]